MTMREKTGRASLAGVAAALFLLVGLPLPSQAAAGTDQEWAARLEYLNNLKYETDERCARVTEARELLSSGERYIANWYDYRVRVLGPDALIERAYTDALNRKYEEVEWLRYLVPVLNKACQAWRAEFRRVLAEIILRRLIEGPRTAGATPTMQPPAPPSSPPPGGATEKECKNLSFRGGWAVATRHMADLSDQLGNIQPNKIAHARTAYRKALVLYRDGRKRCKHGRWPAYFTKRIQEVERELRKLGVRP